MRPGSGLRLWELADGCSCLAGTRSPVTCFGRRTRPSALRALGMTSLPGCERTILAQPIAKMSLLGQAAMLLSFDVIEDAIPEHVEWHTHEHLPERLSIPGFVRGTRWVALQGQPRYFVMYEVEQLATLTSDAYLERLNNPSPWTSKMMPHYRGMTRGFCSVAGRL